MSNICEYVFDPDGDDGGTKTSVKSAWECPLPAHDKAERCVLHMDSESRAKTGVSDDEVREAFVRTVEGAEPGEACRFVGADFGETVVEADSLGRNAEAIDLRNANFEGKFEINCDTVEADLMLDNSELEIFSAPSTVFEGGVSFQGCSFEGKVNLDSAKFEDRAIFKKAKFNLGAEFSEAVFEGDANFRLSKQSGGQTNFKDAVFRGSALMGRVNYDNADFTRAEFHSDTDFSGASFSDETKFQYSAFHGGVDFGNSDFNGNTVFRGAKFADRASFDDASFQGWASFSDVEFNGDASFESAWFKSELKMATETGSNAVIDFSGARMGQASVEPDRSVAVDFTRARVGNVSISGDSRVNNPFDNVRFMETEFNGFNFSEYADYLAEKDYTIHDMAGDGDEDIPPARLEKTYGLAAEGAEGNADSIASKFAKKEAKYRRKKYRKDGRTLKYLLDFLPI